MEIVTVLQHPTHQATKEEQRHHLPIRTTLVQLLQTTQVNMMTVVEFYSFWSKFDRFLLQMNNFKGLSNILFLFEVELSKIGYT